MQAIYGLQKFKNMVRRAGICCRRTNVQSDIIKNTMQKRLLNVSLINGPPVSRRKSEQNPIVTAREDSTVILELEIVSA